MTVGDVSTCMYGENERSFPRRVRVACVLSVVRRRAASLDAAWPGTGVVARCGKAVRPNQTNGPHRSWRSLFRSLGMNPTGPSRNKGD